MFYVYVLKSRKDGRLYIGFTINLIKRFKEHRNGEVNCTKYRRPLELIYYEAYQTEKLARTRERKLKHYGSAWRGLKNRLKLA